MQSDILNQNPTAAIAVHVIWFSVLGGDERSEIRTELLRDHRATHYWDDDGEISSFFSDHAGELGLASSGRLWDAYLLFAPGAVWDEFPTPPVAWGAPVVSELEQLQAEVDRLIGTTGP